MSQEQVIEAKKEGGVAFKWVIDQLGKWDETWIVKKLLEQGLSQESAINLVGKAKAYKKSPEGIKEQIRKDALVLLEPILAFLFSLGILVISEYIWKDALGLFILVALWAIFWVLRKGVGNALAALFRLPYKLINLYFASKRIRP